MKHLIKTLVLGSALAALAPLAQAASISANLTVGGPLTYNYASPNSATASFSPTGNTITAMGSPASTDATVTPYFTIGNLVTFNSAITSPGSFAIGPVGTAINLSPGFLIASSTQNGETLSYYATSYTAQFIGMTSAIVTGMGYFTETCATGVTVGCINYTQTAGTFTFAPTTTGTNSSGFSASTISAAATPEPSSLILLGTGVLGAAGMLRRRFSGKSNA